MLQSLSAAARNLLSAIDENAHDTSIADRFAAKEKQPSKGDLLRIDLNNLAELVANVTESYTSAIFLLDSNGTHLEFGGAHTLSREFVYQSRIPVGSGLVGWVAQTKQRVNVSPFEHDARTLLYYRVDQQLKTFIAVPVLDASGQLLGVIACDSKKSYAFPKFTEKILVNCAQQVQTLLELHRKIPSASSNETSDRGELQCCIDRIREQPSEQHLFNLACDLPDTIVNRDALVVLALNEGGVGEGVFYSKANQSNTGNRLLDIVCKHKRIICGDRSVHALPTDDAKKRSFLSIPFHVLGKEAGSFNLLSLPNTPFEPAELTALEEIAKVFGRELERVRLIANVSLQSNQLGIASWDNFVIQAKLILREARNRKLSVSLLRLRFDLVREIETLAGISPAQRFLEHAIRLVHQVKRNDAIACAVYGPEIFILTASSEVDNTARRFLTLLEKAAPTTIETPNAAINWGKLIHEGVAIRVAHFPEDGTTITELAAKTLWENQSDSETQRVEIAVHAGSR